MEKMKRFFHDGKNVSFFCNPALTGDTFHPKIRLEYAKGDAE